VFSALDATNTYSYGNVLAFQETPGSAVSSSQPTFSVTVTGSDRLPPGCAAVTAAFRFYCDVTEGRGHPVYQIGKDVCHPSFVWRSALACRLCNESEIIEERSACVGNSREVLYRSSSDCVLGGNYSQTITSESCRALEVDETIGGGIAAGVIVLVIILAVIAFIFWRRKREVETKYERLMSDAPMDEIDGHVDLDE